MSTSKTTKDHEEIRRWAESRHAVPSEVEGTHRSGEPGILRFEFPRARNRNELLYQAKTADGQQSNFNKLIHPESEKHSAAEPARERKHKAA